MSSQKISRIQNHPLVANDNMEALLITKPENIIYILGFKIESEVILLVPGSRPEKLDDKIQVYLNALEYDQAKKNIEADKPLADIIETVLIPPGKPKFVQKTVNKFKLDCIGFEEEFISVKRFTEWQEKFRNTQLVGASQILKDARLIKTPKEIDQIKKAASLGDIGCEAVFESIQAGMTEKELAAIAEFEMRKAGSDGSSFDTIIASGENSAYPHALTSEKKVEEGDLIIVDIGARYNGYCSDMTRSFIFGTQTAEKKQLVNLVNNGQQAVLDAIHAGVKGTEMDKLARDYFIQQHSEWGTRFIHSLGHGVGIDIHEDPYLSPLSKGILEENMVLTIEPGLYIPGLGGARTEDLIVIKKDGFECLSHAKKYFY